MDVPAVPSSLAKMRDTIDKAREATTRSGDKRDNRRTRLQRGQRLTASAGRRRWRTRAVIDPIVLTDVFRYFFFPFGFWAGLILLLVLCALVDDLCLDVVESLAPQKRTGPTNGSANLICKFTWFQIRSERAGQKS